MVDCTPVWLSAPLEMHQEMSPFAVRLSCHFETNRSICKWGNWHFFFHLTAQPGPPYYLSVASGPASVLFSLKTMPINGGTPITGYVLQWKQKGDSQWKEISIPVSGEVSSLWVISLTTSVNQLDFLLHRPFGHHQPHAIHFVYGALGSFQCSGSGPVLRK